MTIMLIMAAVNIAELKALLLSSEDPPDEIALTATGGLRLPSAELNEKKFWAIGARNPVTRDIFGIAGAAVSQDRDGRDAGLLGR